MHNLKLIIKREFMARVRNRTFVVMTFLSPLIFIGMISLITWLATINNDEIHKIAFVDETEMFSADLKNEGNIEYIDYSHLNWKVAKDSVKQQKLYGLLYVPKKEGTDQLATSIQFYAEEAPSPSILSKIEQVISAKITERNYREKGLNLDVIKKSKSEVSILVEDFSGEKTSKMASYVKMVFGGVAGYLLMMFIIIYGNMVMRSVIEEKANRIIEIIISSVKPFHLMLGKILGTSFAGVLQFIIWVFLGMILMTVGTFVFGVDVEPVQLQEVNKMIASNGGMIDDMTNIFVEIQRLPLITLTISFLIYFIGGYFLYSAIYAAIGAAVDSETDSQQFMLPVILPLMLGIYVGFFSVIENPHGTVSTIFSMIPLTSPIVMLMRIPFGVPWWEVVISIVLLFGSITFITWFAAKIYRVGILMYGKKASYKELFKWLKYK